MDTSFWSVYSKVELQFPYEIGDNELVFDLRDKSYAVQTSNCF